MNKLKILTFAFALTLATNLSAQTFTTLYSFGANALPWNPSAGIVLSGNTLYGTAVQGSNSWGAVFSVNTDGTRFTVLHNFTANGAGLLPEDKLILSGNTLYGTTADGDSMGYGTVFSINIDGSDFRILHSFTPAGSYPYYTNTDGAIPYAGLVLLGNTL